MKQQVVYIHGGESFASQADFIKRLQTKGIWDLPDPASTVKWTDHLRADLGEHFEVFMPAMPNKQNARFLEWEIWFERHLPYLRDGVILVGCSLGGMFLLKYLLSKSLPVRVGATYFLATPIGLPDFASDDCADFVTLLSQITALNNAGKLFIWHSTDDFLVPYAHAVALANALPGATLVTLTDKNHFLVPAVPELIAHIKGVAGAITA